jgi:hypothetical protein
MKDLPTASQINSLVKSIQSGTVDSRAFNDAMRKLLNSIDVTFRKPAFRGEMAPPRPTRQPPLTPALQEVEKEMGQILKKRLEPQMQVEEKEVERMRTPIKPARNIFRSPIELPLKDIRAYLKENPGVAAQLKDKNGQRIRYTQLTKSRGSKGVSIFDTNLIEIWGQEETKEGSGIGKYNPVQKQPRNTVIIGRGISAQEQPSWVEFGKFVINRHHLENQDIFNVKYKNCMGAIPSFKPVAVSDIYRDFVIDLLDNGRPNNRVYNQVSDEERKHFQTVASAAGVFRGLGIPKTIIDTEEKDIKRFEILRGQISSGNNNPKLLDETRKLVIKLMNADRLKKKEGLDILLELSAM